MNRILITGRQSFVGINYIKYSKFKRIDTVSLLNYTPERVPFHNYDTVLHLIAIVHQPRLTDKNEYFKINRDLCIRVAELAKEGGVKQFVFLSTIKVYGKYRDGSKKWNEHSECFPDDAYGQSKYEAEEALKKLNDENFVVSIVRTPLVYGEGVKANMKNIIKLISRFKILPFKNTNNKRHFTAAENLVAFIDRIIDMRIPGTFIAMDQKPVSTEELVKLISKCMNRKIYLFKLPDILLKIGILLLPSIFERLYGSFEIDNSETLKKLDFTPVVSFEEEIKKMVVSIHSTDHSLKN
jgi:nucleoside-diphosphate-sugar epimerase